MATWDILFNTYDKSMPIKSDLDFQCVSAGNLSAIKSESTPNSSSTLHSQIVWSNADRKGDERTSQCKLLRENAKPMFKRAISSKTMDTRRNKTKDLNRF